VAKESWRDLAAARGAVHSEQLISKTGWLKPEFAKNIRSRQIDFYDLTNKNKIDGSKVES
jgi:hypothetical protein